MLEGIIRESTSKSYTKKLRKEGYLIANVFGKGIENINAAFKLNDFIRYLRNKKNIAFDVKIGDKELKVVVKEYQKDPVTGMLLHVDLQVAVSEHKAYYLVPVRTTGTPKGLKNKGLLQYHRRRVKVKCAIENLPNEFVFDVSNLDVGDNILIRDIELPEGVECFIDPRVPIVGVIKAK